MTTFERKFTLPNIGLGRNLMRVHTISQGEVLLSRSVFLPEEI
jgi:hypothetical protein